MIQQFRKKYYVLTVICCWGLFNACANSATQSSDTSNVNTNTVTSTTQQNRGIDSDNTLNEQLTSNNLDDVFYKRLVAPNLEMHLLQGLMNVSGSYYNTESGDEFRVAGDTLFTNANENILYEFYQNYADNSIDATADLAVRHNNGKWRINRQLADGSATDQLSLLEKYDDNSTPLTLIKSVKQTAKNCEDSACFTIKLVYPQITGNSIAGNVMQLINQQIKSEVAKLIGGGEANNIDTAIKKEFAIYNKEDSDYKRDWEIEILTDVWYNRNNLLSISLNTYSYLGGVHPNTYVVHLNFDLTTAEILDFNDVVQEKAMVELTEIASNKLKQQFDVDKLTDAGFFENELKLSENFYFTPCCMHFFYNTYDIAPYVMGSQTVSIPFHTFNPLVKLKALQVDDKEH